MIILSNTTDILEAVLGGAVTTNQMRCVASWRDITTSAFTPGRTVILTNGATPVNVVGSPAASTQRVVDFVNIYNADTVTQTLTVQFNDNGTRYTLISVSLLTGESIQYSEGNGWSHLSASGSISGVQSIAGTANEITASPATGNVTVSLPTALTFTGKTIAGGTYNSPTLVTPALGTPASGNLVNCTGYTGTTALVTAGALTATSLSTGSGAISGGAISGTSATLGSLDVSNSTAVGYFGATITNTDATGFARLLLRVGTGGGTGIGYLLYAPSNFLKLATDAATEPIIFSPNNTNVAQVTTTGFQGPLGQTTPAAGSFTTLNASAAFTNTMSRAKPVITSSTSTNDVTISLINGGGRLDLGRENSTSSEFGVAAYSSVLYSNGNYHLFLGANGVPNVLDVYSTGLAVTGTVDINGTAASATAGHLQLGSSTQSTIGANGAASALTANPLGYLVAYLGTTKIIIPYYNA